MHTYDAGKRLGKLHMQRVASGGAQSPGLTSFMAGSELTVLTSVALKGVLEALAPAFLQETGYGLAMRYGPGGVVLQRVRSGAGGDVVIAPPEVMETLAGEGRIVAGSARTIAHSVIGIAVRAGAPKPKIETADDLRRALLAAPSVAYTDPATGAASGVHLAGILERFGIADAVNARAKLGDGVRWPPTWRAARPSWRSSRFASICW